ncbi:MAG: lipase maturation factor family protein [Planctomycetota bacterium]
MKGAASKSEAGERAPRGWHVARWLYLRLLGVVFLIAFGSLWVQLEGLFGSRGIAPVEEVLWLEASDLRLHALLAAGVALALLLVADVAPALCCLALWLLYLGLTAAGAPFLNFQWDALLIEAGFLGALAAPWRIAPRPSRDRAPPLASLLLLRWLLFRLMVLSGLVKLLSGDETWRDLSAMSFHYWTQPLPGPTSRFVHGLPGWFHAGEVVATFAIELVLPFFVFGPRVLQRVAFLGMAGLQVAIACTGNYGFFNLLTFALCLPLLDDGLWRHIAPARLRGWGPLAADLALRPTAARRMLVAPLALALAGLGAIAGAQRCLGWEHTPGWMLSTLRKTAPLRTANSYGLFAVMTTERPEIIVEGSRDGRSWEAYEFRWKPGRTSRRPGVVQPHMPRLDWQMWFAALGNYRNNPWFLAFARRLLEGSPPVLALLAHDPFAGRPPRYLRARVFTYRFAPADSALWWEREELGLYCPVLTLQDGELVRAR